MMMDMTTITDNFRPSAEATAITTPNPAFASQYTALSIIPAAPAASTRGNRSVNGYFHNIYMRVSNRNIAKLPGNGDNAPVMALPDASGRGSAAKEPAFFTKRPILNKNLKKSCACSPAGGSLRFFDSGKPLTKGGSG